MKKHLIRLFALAAFISCSPQKEVNDNTTPPEEGTYAFDRSFLDHYTRVIELADGPSKILLAPQYQGRVMTSTCRGDSGISPGWINYDLIRSGDTLPHMNAYGGEERLWLGPEGGQYALFFKPGAPFEFEHWFTPAEFDTEPFDVSDRSPSAVTFKKDLELVNHAGTSFTMRIFRTVHLMTRDEIAYNLNTDPGDSVHVVAYESQNQLINKGDQPWTKEGGLVSIWMLGMLKPSADVTVVLPIKPGPEGDLGPAINANYFGPIPDSRLKVRDSVVFFKADGRERGKLGIPPQRAKSIIGSYDAQHRMLTLLQCEVPKNNTAYVNSAWEMQTEPYGGDVFNSYNDGPLQDGSQLGPFYELEASSPAGALAPGQTLVHRQLTYHFEGDEAALNRIARQTLGVSIEQIKSVWNTD